MASDFHTHNPQSIYRALISTPVVIKEKFTSMEIHPWFLPEMFDSHKIPEKIELDKFTALGEIGLDKLRGPEISIQEMFFQQLLILASECKKPVVIHCVRKYPETIKLLKPFKLKVMFHGFHSSPELLDELWGRGYTVSFHHSAVKNSKLMNKLKSATGEFGFESDNDPSVDIASIIATAEKNTRINNLEKITDQNFDNFLEI